jgi:FkbM family methyltransferase
MNSLKGFLRTLLNPLVIGIEILIYGLIQLIRFLPRGEQIVSGFLERNWSRTSSVNHKNVELKFIVPNWLTKFRANSFAVKEPETLLWIEKMEPGKTFWDIGANVGIYSIYAAKKQNVNVVAFEPSLLNLEILLRNVLVNDLNSKITLIPLALSNKNAVQQLFMSKSDFIWGGAHNSMGKNVGQDGKELLKPIISSQISISMDSCLEVFGLKQPDYVKIDVDGLEMMVLSGGEKTFQKVRSVLIEVDKAFEGQSANVSKFLTSLGFIRLNNLDNLKLDENQIWVHDI